MASGSFDVLSHSGLQAEVRTQQIVRDKAKATASDPKRILSRFPLKNLFPPFPARNAASYRCAGLARRRRNYAAPSRVGRLMRADCRQIRARPIFALAAKSPGCASTSLCLASGSSAMASSTACRRSISSRCGRLLEFKDGGGGGLPHVLFEIGDRPP